MVLLVLAIVWAAVLGSWLRSRAGKTFGDSVGTFRRHLTVLERAAPVRVQPANSMRGPASIPVPPRLRVAGSSGSDSYGQPVPLSARLAAAQEGASRSAKPAPGAGRHRAAAPAQAAMSPRRRRTLQRRRQVLFFLLAAVAGTLLLGAIPGLHKLLYANVVFDLMLAGYVALLIRLRNLHAERDMKLTFLPPVKAVPAGMVLRGTGRYASLASAMDTGEVLLQRAAN